ARVGEEGRRAGSQRPTAAGDREGGLRRVDSDGLVAEGIAQDGGTRLCQDGPRGGEGTGVVGGRTQIRERVGRAIGRQVRVEGRRVDRQEVGGRARLGEGACEVDRQRVPRPANGHRNVAGGRLGRRQGQEGGEPQAQD